MKAVPGVYKDGKVTLSEAIPGIDPGPIKVLIVFPEEADDPWQRIINEPAPRPAFLKFAEEVMEEIAQGKTERLDPKKL